MNSLNLLKPRHHTLYLIETSIEKLFDSTGQNNLKFALISTTLDRSMKEHPREYRKALKRKAVSLKKTYKAMKMDGYF